jgi:hypothetical protein
MHKTLTLFLSGLLLWSSACVGGSPGADEFRPDISGTITGVYPAEGALRERGMLGSILVESSASPPGTKSPYDKASVTVTVNTRIFEQTTAPGQERRPVVFEALQVGQSVQVEFTGPVIESYPVQATAGAVVILREGS